MIEKTLWGIHAGKTGDADTLFLKQKRIALGWAAMGDLTALNPDREAFKSRVAHCYPEIKLGAIPNNAGQLFRFVHEMKTGDFVAYPSKQDRKIYLGRVTGDYKYEPTSSPGYPNTRSVEWLKDVPRTKFSQGALHEIGSAMSFFQIKNYSDEFYAVIEGKPVTPSVQQDETVGLVKVQVKSSESSIGNPQVAELYGNVSAQEFGLFVTLSNFTSQAWAFAKGKPNLRLIDGDELVQLVLTHYDRFDSAYKGVLPLRKVHIPDAVNDEGDL